MIHAIEYAQFAQKLPALEDRFIDQGCDQSAIATLLHRFEELRFQSLDLLSSRIVQHLQASQCKVAEAYAMQTADEPPGLPPPKWDTGISSLDHLTGGGYGMTVIGGAPKAGKSLLALGAALSAAVQGWRVVYLNAELTRSEMANRIRRFYGRIDDELLNRFDVVNVESGFSVNHAIEATIGCIGLEDSKLLIVQDSINRLADISLTGNERDNAYFGRLRDWQEFARTTSKDSAGVISHIIVSELNSQNKIKGRNLEYAADLVVSVSGSEVSMDRNYVDIDVTLARSSNSGSLGSFYRDWKTGRFLDGEAKG